jgi:hypothetical protein
MLVVSEMFQNYQLTDFGRRGGDGVGVLEV